MTNLTPQAKRIVLMKDLAVILDKLSDTPLAVEQWKLVVRWNNYISPNTEQEKSPQDYNSQHWLPMAHI